MDNNFWSLSGVLASMRPNGMSKNENQYVYQNVRLDELVRMVAAKCVDTST